MPSLEEPDQQLVAIVSLAREPVPPEVAAHVLGLTVDETLAVGEGLASRGLIADTADGFTSISRKAAHDAVDSLGGARRAALVARLAEALDRHGWANHSPGVVGTYYAQAHEWSRALPLLDRAATTAIEHGELGEALPFLDAALEAYERSGVEDYLLEGRLRLERGRYYQQAGQSDLAATDFDVAAHRLNGVLRIDALGFLASVEDDRQDAQAGERTAAVALWEAASQGQLTKGGSLLTFQARVLSRLGFQFEADSSLEKGIAHLEGSGSPYQLFLAKFNRARLLFDRGEARSAEAAFEELVEVAEEIDGSESLAEKLVWLARARFLVGKPDQGLEALTQSLLLVERTGAEGSLFLGHMAMSEGAALYGIWQEALAEAGATLDLVLAHLPAWENAARVLRGRALLGLGRNAEAADEAQRALELGPPGINGWRWRLKIKVLQLQIAAAEAEPWPRSHAEDLTDELLQGRWLDSAAELMTLRAAQENDPELATQAAGLALQLGIPTKAAQAAQAGQLWEDPVALAIARAVRAATVHIPEDWRKWTKSPEISSALAVDDTADDTADEAAAALRRELDEALTAAGLADPASTLSPAQRRSAGLVRRRPVRRAIRGAVIAAAVVALGVAGGVLGVLALDDESPPGTTLGPPPEEILVPPPELIPGQWPTSGGSYQREGATDRVGIRNPGGILWADQTGGFEASPITLGQMVIVGSIDGRLHMYDKRKRDPGFASRTDGAIRATATAAAIDPGGGGRRTPLVFVPSTDGHVYAFDAQDGSQVWKQPLSATGSPVTENNLVYVGAADGYVYALDALDEGRVIDKLPDGDEALAPITTSLSLWKRERVLFFGRGSELHFLDLTTRESGTCGRVQAFSEIQDPVIHDDLVYVASADGSLRSFVAATCSQGTEYGPVARSLEFPPAITEGVIYHSMERGLAAQPIERGRELPWAAAPTNTDFADIPIASSSPVVTETHIYFGSQDGRLFAIDRADGSEEWSFRIGTDAVSTPVVLDGVIYAASFDGTIRAIAQEPGE